MEGYTNTSLFKLKTISQSQAQRKKPCSLIQAARHNLREQQDEHGARAHIDPQRTHLNHVLKGPSSAVEVARLADSIMRSAGVKLTALRHDYAQAIELVFSLPASTSVRVLEYFMDCTNWAIEYFGVGNVLSSIVHFDESAPHCHILVLPLVDGRMNARALRLHSQLIKMRASYAEKVAAKHGLKTSFPQRITAAHRRTIAIAVLARMNATEDPSMRSPVWQAIREAIETAPEEFATALGVELSPPPKTVRKQKTLAEIMTKPVDFI